MWRSQERHGVLGVTASELLDPMAYELTHALKLHITTFVGCQLLPGATEWHMGPLQLQPRHLSRDCLSFPRCTRRTFGALCCSNQICAAVIAYEQQAPLYECHRCPAVQDYCTLATQCSLDRWPRFAQQAASWNGPVSVAVYMPAPRTSQTARAAEELLHSYHSQYTQQHPTQHVTVSALYANHFVREGASALHQSGAADTGALTQHDAADSTSYDQLYPINTLRNLALQQADTPLVLTADADLIPSLSLREILQEPGTLQLLGIDVHHQQQQLTQSPSTQQQQQQDSSQKSPVMLVLPVFELNTQQELPDGEHADIPKNKAELAAALAAGSVQPFHCGVFAPRQQPIDVQEWLAAEEVYEVQYVEFFEPQGIAVKQQLPAYDERFRGYGLNKVQHAWHMNTLGYTFKVLPNAFLVTAPHKRSSSWRPVPGSSRDKAHLARIRAVYEMFKQDLAEKH